MTTNLDALCKATEFLDHDSPVVREFVRATLPDDTRRTDVDRVRALYYAVRDGIQYEVYGMDLSRSGLRASAIIERGVGFCVHKVIVYAAAVRSLGIPSRLVYADVRNHLASERLRRLVGGDVFCFHSMASVHVEGAWVKATPVFNKLLCRLYKIRPLDFDGRSDSLYHPYDEHGRRHMEFLRMRGEFDDVPYEALVKGIERAHPLLFESSRTVAAGSLVADAITERGSDGRENNVSP